MRVLLLCSFVGLAGAKDTSRNLTIGQVEDAGLEMARDFSQHSDQAPPPIPRRKLTSDTGSSASYLKQAMFLSPSKTPDNRVKISGGGKGRGGGGGGVTPLLDTGRSKGGKGGSKKKKDAGASLNAERAAAIAAAEEIGGPLMTRVAEGLRAAEAAILDIAARIGGGGSSGSSSATGAMRATSLSAAGPASDAANNLVDEEELNIDVEKVFSQGIEFQSPESRQALVDKFMLEILPERVEERHFVVGVMGTSVTAGHDNWFNESWSMQLQHWLSAPLEAAGVLAEVRNRAIGGNRYETSAYCTAATVGNDVDAFFFEFNMIFHGPADAYEHFIRNVVGGIPTRPTFCQMLGFDAVNPEIPKRADETGDLVKGNPQDIDLNKNLIKGKYRGRQNNGKYQDWSEWVPLEQVIGLPKKERGVYSFSRPPHYWKEGRTNLFEHYGNPAPKSAGHLGAGAGGKSWGTTGMHWSDPDGINHEVGHLREYWGVSVNGNKAAPCGSAAWHPGPKAHAIRGMVLAHAYLKAFDEALRKVVNHVSSQQGGMFKTGEAAALSSAKSLLGNLQREAKAMAPLPLPMSKALTSFFPYPKCALTMMPADPAASLLKLVVEGQRTSEGRAVVDGRKKGNIAAVPNIPAWQVVAPPWAVNEVRCDDKAGYLDRKWALHGTTDSGWLSLHFHVELDQSPLALCEVSCLWGKCPKGRGSLLEDVEFELDSDPNLQQGSTSEGGGGGGRGGVVRGGRANSVTAIMPDEKVDGGPTGSPLLKLLMKSKVCVEIARPDGTSLGLSAGAHEIRVRVNKPETYVLLSHMIWY